MVAIAQLLEPALDVPRAVEPRPRTVGPSLFDRVATLEHAVATLPARSTGVALIASSGGLESTLAAFNIAIGAASMGEPADMYFAFWALGALRRVEPSHRSRTWIERLMGAILPRGAAKLRLARMNFGGAGTRMLEHRMKSLNIPRLAELIEMAKSSGVKIHVCATSLEMMGLTLEDLVDYPALQVAGVGSFLSIAMERRISMVF